MAYRKGEGMTNAIVKGLVGVVCPVCHQGAESHGMARQSGGVVAITCPDGRLLVEGDWTPKSCPIPDPMAWAKPATRLAARQMMHDHRPFRRSELAKVPDPSPWLKEIDPKHAERIRHLEGLYDRMGRQWKKVQRGGAIWYAERRRALMDAGATYDEAQAAYPQCFQ
jgi:hypothetical protein